MVPHRRRRPHRRATRRLHVDGRVDDLVNTGGLKVAPRLVEEAIIEHVPGVRRGRRRRQRRDPEWGEAVCALVVLEPGAVRAGLDRRRPAGAPARHPARPRPAAAGRDGRARCRPRARASPTGVRWRRCSPWDDDARAPLPPGPAQPRADGLLRRWTRSRPTRPPCATCPRSRGSSSSCSSPSSARSRGSSPAAPAAPGVQQRSWRTPRAGPPPPRGPDDDPDFLKDL